ncbi:MAG TPA: putative toxin-antitoxin system toxin component, PIN family [Candidatus Babeliaceae bacterium]|nr:putative toxin-antitoxin system toxin component, PIN family [Candidatus Babeliaceae bacterium]
MVFVLDCNIWITLTINSQTKFIANLSDKGSLIASCHELRNEIHSVLQRPKLTNFITLDMAEKVISLHDLVTANYKIGKIKPIVADLKDNYLFALAEKSKSDFIVTGDKLLLAVGQYKNVKIISLSEFKKLLA